jgi:DNA-binding NtrC family response regulator
MVVYAFDNQTDLKQLEETLYALLGNELEFCGFTNMGSLLHATMRRKYDVVFTEVESNTGIMLLGALQRLYTRSNFIGVSNKEDERTALMLHRIYASDYIIKPYDPERLADSLRHLRYPLRDRQQVLISI